LLTTLRHEIIYGKMTARRSLSRQIAHLFIHRQLNVHRLEDGAPCRVNEVVTHSDPRTVAFCRAHETELTKTDEPPVSHRLGDAQSLSQLSHEEVAALVARIDEHH
jgi:hypothetical protein